MQKLAIITALLLGASIFTAPAADKKAKATAKSAPTNAAPDDFLPTFGEELARVRKSIEEYTRQIRKAPKDAQAYFARSQAYAAVGEHTKARQDRKKALELNPGLKPELDQYEDMTAKVVPTEVAIGYEFLRRGKYDFARLKFNSAIEADPGSPAGYVAMAVFLQSQNQHAKALELFKKAVGIDPNYDPAYYQRAIAYLKNGEYAKALPDLNKLLEKQKRAEVYYLRSRAYRNLKQDDLADQDYQKALEMDAEVAAKVPEF